jgi:hypothetical protein
MKTAMQELKDEISQIFHDNKISLKIDISKYLEKEKEQIIEAVEFGLFNMHTTIDGKYYYDLKYNKNK